MLRKHAGDADDWPPTVYVADEAAFMPELDACMETESREDKVVVLVYLPCSGLR